MPAGPSSPPASAASTLSGTRTATAVQAVCLQPALCNAIQASARPQFTAWGVCQKRRRASLSDRLPMSSECRRNLSHCNGLEPVWRLKTVPQSLPDGSRCVWAWPVLGVPQGGSAATVLVTADRSGRDQTMATKAKLTDARA